MPAQRRTVINIAKSSKLASNPVSTDSLIRRLISRSDLSLINEYFFEVQGDRLFESNLVPRKIVAEGSCRENVKNKAKRDCRREEVIIFCLELLKCHS
jgi:hypothetical protein